MKKSDSGILNCLIKATAKQTAITSVKNNQSINKINNLRIFGCTAIFFVLNIILLSYHETWMDEIQAWEIQKNNDLIGIYSACKTEGHPMLWYIILKPFTTLGFPIITMNILSILFMTASVYILVKYIDAQWIVKIALIAGCMFYYNSVQARTYSLVTLAVILQVITYEKRAEHPYKHAIQLQLLTQTHIIMCGFIASFWLLWVYDIVHENGIRVTKYNKKAKEQLKALLLFSAFIIFLIVQLLGIGVQQNTNMTIAEQMKSVPVSGILQISGTILAIMLGGTVVLVSTFTATQIIELSSCADIPDIVLKAVSFISSNQFIIPAIQQTICVFMLVNLWNYNKRKLLIVLVGDGAAVFISMLIYSLSIQRAFVQIFAFLVIYISQFSSVDKEKRKEKVYLIARVQMYVLLAITITMNVQLAYRQTYCQFGLDISQDKLLESHVDKDDTLICVDDSKDTVDPINLAYILNKPYYNIKDDSYITYQKYMGYTDAEYDADIPMRDIQKFIQSNNIDKQKIVLVQGVLDDSDSDSSYIKFLRRNFYTYYSVEIDNTTVNLYGSKKISLLKLK